MDRRDTRERQRDVDGVWNQREVIGISIWPPQPCTNEDGMEGKRKSNKNGQKRKVIRVESEETQDYVRDSLNLSQEEAEKISFVPSALSIPRGPVFWCDTGCSDKALRFWQFASVVIDEGEKSPHDQFVSSSVTTNGCRHRARCR